jgi:hypothetical protein
VTSKEFIDHVIPHGNSPMTASGITDSKQHNPKIAMEMVIGYGKALKILECSLGIQILVKIKN